MTTTGDGNRGGEADRQDRQGSLSHSGSRCWMTTVVDRLWDSVEKEREELSIEGRKEEGQRSHAGRKSQSRQCKHAGWLDQGLRERKTFLLQQVCLLLLPQPVSLLMPADAGHQGREQGRQGGRGKTVEQKEEMLFLSLSRPLSLET